MRFCVAAADDSLVNDQGIRPTFFSDHRYRSARKPAEDVGAEETPWPRDRSCSPT
ncbi:hypothetical protein EIB18_16770 [Caulobacter vibrioides]|nr:hypothetical protein CA608_20440 [Caulobacter vibrioides]AZH14192.1 hypothetical protein EIB18_16770 [Caulobacter vibrioides]PLR16826.1 hypothetical protein CVUC_00335 [Caulobacter vibrioides]